MAEEDDMLWESLKHFFDRAYRSLGAAFLIWGIAALFDIIISPLFLTALFLLCFGIYILNRYTDVVEDQENKQLPSTPHLYKWVGLVSIILALVLALWFNLLLFLIMLVPLLIGFLYSVTLFPKHWKYHRIKQIPIINTASVAASISFLFIFSLFSFSAIPLYTATMLFLFFFIQVMIGTIIPNIADIPGDQKAGINTIPILLGISKTKQTLYLLQALSLILLLIGLTLTVLPSHLWLLSVITVTGLPVIWKTTKTNAKTMERIHEFNVTYFLPLLILAWHTPLPFI